MTSLPVQNTAAPASGRRRQLQTWRNVLRYTIVRFGTLVLTVVVAVYLIIIIANLGGFVDDIVRARIDQSLMGMVQGGWLSGVPEDEKLAIIEQTTAAMQEEAGLNRPFLLRTFGWLWDGLTLNWGEVSRPRAYGGGTLSTDVRDIILDHMSRTVAVFGLANVLMFGATVFGALWLMRHYGGWFDRLVMALSPLSSAPAWVYGVILNVAFLKLFGFSAGGTLDAWPSDMRLAYVPVLLRHLALPLLAIFLTGLFQGLYAWRSYFLSYANEDYVDMARAKGLTSRMVERRYVLRPALPALLTSFALLAALLWQEVIALEFFFNVAGIGRLFVSALNAFDTPVIVGLTVTFAYLLALTVFVLDIAYVLVDPRIRVGEKQQRGTPAQARKRRTRWKSAERPTPRPARTWPRPTLPTAAEASSAFRRARQFVRETFSALLRYPSAVIGLTIIMMLLAVSVYTVVAIPYSEAIALWRDDDYVWARTPRRALPTWVNWFRVDDLPETLVFDSRADTVDKTRRVVSEDTTEVIYRFPIAYPYRGGFPQDIVIDFSAEFESKAPFIVINWLTPDGREQELAAVTPRAGTESFYVSRDERLQRRLDTQFPQEALFADPANSELALTGDYELQIIALMFEPEATLDAEITLYGQVYGLMGTDSNRRDMMIALLWGTPIALTFGIVAAVATSVGSMVLAALAAWYGGWTDRVIQFLTDTNMILPFFPVSLLIFILYSKSLWAILGVTVALSIFGSSVKTYRAIFLQVRSAPYVEAAQAYGASDWRIVTRYLVPRIVSVLIPRLIILVPSYVFLEATLTFLGVTDLMLPTWGKLVVAALSGSIYSTTDHVVLAPLALLFLTGFAFAMVGVVLERIFEPRLREV